MGAVQTKVEIEHINRNDLIQSTVIPQQAQVAQANFAKSIEETNQNNMGARRKSLEIQNMAHQQELLQKLRRESQTKKTKTLPPLVSERKNNIADRLLLKPQMNCEQKQQKDNPCDKLDEVKQNSSCVVNRGSQRHFGDSNVIDKKESLKNACSETILQEVQENEMPVRSNCVQKRSKKFRPQRIV